MSHDCQKPQSNTPTIVTDFRPQELIVRTHGFLAAGQGALAYCSPIALLLLSYCSPIALLLLSFFISVVPPMVPAPRAAHRCTEKSVTIVGFLHRG